MVRLRLPALTVLCGALFAFVLSTPPVAKAQPAGGSGPFVNFAPIYAGHNNGDALGGVGSHANVTVSSLNALPTWNTASAHTVDLYLVSVASENPGGCIGAAYFHLGSTPLATTSGGSFTFGFVWPTALTKSAGPVYALCLHEEAVATAHDYTSATPANASGNPGTFTVTTNAPASLAVMPGVVHPGDVLTVTGQNWSPNYSDSADDAITVSIGTCNSGNVLGSQANLRPDGNGNFSVSFTIPDSAAAASYQACAASTGGAQIVDATSSAHPPTFQVAAVPPTATDVPPTATATDVPPTPTTTGTATSTTSSTTTATGSGSGTSDNGLLIALLIGFVAALTLAGALIFYFLSRRNGPPPPPSGPGGPDSPIDPRGFATPSSFPALPDLGGDTLPNATHAPSWTPPPSPPPAPGEPPQPPLIWG